MATDWKSMSREAIEDQLAVHRELLQDLLQQHAEIAEDTLRGLDALRDKTPPDPFRCDQCGNYRDTPGHFYGCVEHSR